VFFVSVEYLWGYYFTTDFSTAENIGARSDRRATHAWFASIKRRAAWPGPNLAMDSVAQVIEESGLRREAPVAS
jgi:hypothetical protein